MELARLIKMANEIGGFFAQLPDRDTAATSIATHLKNFWEPRMRHQIIEYAEQDGGGLDELVRAAVLSLRPTPRAG